GVHDVVAVRRARARLEGRRQVDVRDAEVAQVGDERARRGEAEVARQLQPVGRARLGHPRRSSTIDRETRSGAPPASSSTEPGSSSERAVSSTSVQRSPNAASGSVKSQSSWWPLNSIRNDSSRTWRPRASGVLISSPLRKTPSTGSEV